MHVLVTGVTGLIGTSLSKRLYELGHSVVGLSRNADNAIRRLPYLQKTYTWDSLSEAPDPQIFDGVEVVIHLAGEPIGMRWTRHKKLQIEESRTISTRNLVHTLSQLKKRPAVFVSASSWGYYGNRGTELLNEDSISGSDFLSTVCVRWEQEAIKAESLGIRVLRIRSGLVLDTKGGALAPLALLTKLGAAGRLGSGQQWWSWIHIEDEVGLMLHAIESNINGPINASSPSPVTQYEFSRILARALKRPHILRTPSFMLRGLLGEFSTELLFSRRMSPSVALASGYAYRFSGLKSALNDFFLNEM